MGGNGPKWRPVVRQGCKGETAPFYNLSLVPVYPQAEEMINDVRDAFKANLKNLEWMDNETRDAAESKADAITDMIGEFSCHLTTK